MITCANGTKYEFIYDTFGRVIEIKLNDQTFVAYQYAISKNGVVTDKITRQIIGTDIYDFAYDTKLRLLEVKLNNKVMVNYEYDSASNVSKKTDGTKVSYFDHDTKGKLIRETRENGDSLNYDYDNLGQLQKTIIDINETNRSYDFEYLNEYNEYHSESLKTRIDKAFNDDIIDFNALNSGMYGAKPERVWGTKTTFNNKKLFRLDKMTSKIIYPLDSINSSRKQLITGGEFNNTKWKKDFEDNKTMFVWFRFTGSITTSGQGHKIFAFGTDSTDDYFVTLRKSGSNFIFSLIGEYGMTLCTNTVPATSELIFIGLKLYRDWRDGHTGCMFTVNESTRNSTTATPAWVSKLTKFVLGDRNITLGSMTSNPFIQDVSLISIGAFNYGSSVFKSLMEEENRFSGIKMKPKTGVSFIDQKAYDGFEVMTLNGSFKSTNGRTPRDYEFVDGTYKLDKTKLFKYDEGLERHVYGSYSSAQGLGMVKSLLTYKHDLSTECAIAVNFKIESSSNMEKTVVDFKDGNISKLAIRRNTNGQLVVTIDDNAHITNLPIVINEWHRLLVKVEKNGINTSVYIYLNSITNSQKIDTSSILDLTDTRLIVGSSINTANSPISHLDGVLEMLALKNISTLNNQVEIIVSKAQKLSVKTEIDDLGRSVQDIIDTGIPVDLSTGKTKKLISQYFYKNPNGTFETKLFSADINDHSPKQWANVKPQPIYVNSRIRIDCSTSEKHLYDNNNKLIGRFNGFAFESPMPFRIRINGELKEYDLNTISLSSHKNEIYFIHDYSGRKYSFENKAEIFIEFNTFKSNSTTSLQIGETQGFDGFSRGYKYDNVGNIVKVELEDSRTDECTTYEYKYDELSRIIEEYDPFVDKTKKYRYTENNNIIESSTYAGKTTSLESKEIYKYDISYKDRLAEIKVEDYVQKTQFLKRFIYGGNNSSNPTKFDNKSFTWQGRWLKTINDNISYEYNDAGIRTSKTVDGITTNYHLIGEKVGALSKAKDKLFFHYNEQDTLVGFEYDKENYFFYRDLTGVITSIVDINGKIMVKYLYDAWGNWLNKNSAAKTEIGQVLVALNPFIYKGYIYDEESNFYYLQTRYYAPDVRRFINADRILGEIGDVANHNLYTYCGNNPISNVDPNGKSWKKFFKIIAKVAAVVAVVAVCVAVTVATAGVGGAVLAGAGGVILAGGTAVAVGVALTAEVAAAIAEIDERHSGSYTVYGLYDSDGNCVYVGRTKNYEERTAWHLKDKANLGVVKAEPIAKGLTYSEARGLEQYYMLHHGTKSALNKINGISKDNKNLWLYIASTQRVAGSLYNRITNEILNWLGK